MKRPTKLLVLLGACVPSTFALASVKTLSTARMNNLSLHHHSHVLSLRGGAEVRRPGLFLVGHIGASLKNLISRSDTACKNSVAAFRFSDIFIILFVSFLPNYILRLVNDYIVNTTIRREHPLEFEDTPYLSKISAMICQVGQLGLWVYFGELLLVFLSTLDVPNLHDKPKLLASAVYGFWVARKLSQFKAHLINQFFQRYPNRAKKNLASTKVLYNRTLDTIIYLIMTLLLLDANSIDAGVALKSLLTLGGVSSVVVGLALKDPVSEIITGTSVLLSDKFSTGEVIQLGDGTTGRVQGVQWTDISVRGNDDSSVRIPHSQLAKQRIINLSRTPNSVVNQQVRLPYKGTAPIKALVENIKREIIATCPKLLADDGYRNLLVHWTDFERDSIVISIEAHFAIARLSPEYWDNRQDLLFSISRAVEKYNAVEKYV